MDAIHALKKRAVHSCKDLVGFIILLLEKGWDGGVGGVTTLSVETEHYLK